MMLKKLAVALAAAGFASGAYATNGMNLDSYGPIAGGMGGASMAYDNGTAAVMNNPATLGLMSEGSRLDIALGGLHPDVNLSNDMMGYDEDSKSTAFYMPAIGWAKKTGKLTYGLALFAQGGMGTEYDPGLGAQYSAMGLSAGYAMGYGLHAPSDTLGLSSLTERSEVGVGRLILPVAYNVNDRFNVGGSLDFVWAMMDLKMAMPGAMMYNMIGSGLISGTMVDGLMGQMSDGSTAGITDIYGGYFDFSDSSDFTGKAKGYGYAGKLGFTYKLSNTVSLGATYHSKTSLGDMSTDNAKVSLAMQVTDGAGNYQDVVQTMTGKIKVKDFQWPETYGVGASWQATDRLMLAMDVKRIRWSKVMKDFTMQFNAPDGSVMLATMPQNWDDQTVLSLGVGYKATDKLSLRAGYNRASNPIPNSTVNYLFPAIVEEHYTMGFGYDLTPSSEVNFSLALAPSVKVTASDGSKIDHSQTSWQLMYSNKF
ncbi:aromatic hydrocarbon degradation protein [Parasulfuritortus cantonensis]|uniref:Aromatic hydrocarbon degradation protein n=1 Tax=Parasulfuritortus cantonensis TaxID=2528202 RepID=A0A4R1BDB9_9PROT|nr:outer membrane protein transport protein [Parasulfuritortus cantonensis]TCJ15053.1 aromatic hydrocarbon degradation protein [Parasulfuritortus cantonensis]